MTIENNFILNKYLKKRTYLKALKRKHNNNNKCNITKSNNSNFLYYGLTRHVLKKFIEKNDLSGFRNAK